MPYHLVRKTKFDRKLQILRILAQAMFLLVCNYRRPISSVIVPKNSKFSRACACACLKNFRVRVRARAHVSEIFACACVRKKLRRIFFLLNQTQFSICMRRVSHGKFQGVDFNETRSLKNVLTPGSYDIKIVVIMSIWWWCRPKKALNWLFLFGVHL